MIVRRRRTSSSRPPIVEGRVPCTPSSTACSDGGSTSLTRVLPSASRRSRRLTGAGGPDASLQQQRQPAAEVTPAGSSSMISNATRARRSRGRPVITAAGEPGGVMRCDTLVRLVGCSSDGGEGAAEDLRPIPLLRVRRRAQELPTSSPPRRAATSDRRVRSCARAAEVRSDEVA